MGSEDQINPEIVDVEKTQQNPEPSHEDKNSLNNKQEIQTLIDRAKDSNFQEILKHKLQEGRTERNRRLEILQLPPTTTNEQIRQMIDALESQITNSPEQLEDETKAAVRLILLKDTLDWSFGSFDAAIEDYDFNRKNNNKP